MSLFFYALFLLGFAQPDQINFEETRGALMEDVKLVSTIEFYVSYFFLYCLNLMIDSTIYLGDFFV